MTVAHIDGGCSSCSVCVVNDEGVGIVGVDVGFRVPSDIYLVRSVHQDSSHLWYRQESQSWTMRDYFSYDRDWIFHRSYQCILRASAVVISALILLLEQLLTFNSQRVWTDIPHCLQVLPCFDKPQIEDLKGLSCDSSG